MESALYTCLGNVYYAWTARTGNAPERLETYPLGWKYTVPVLT